MLKKLDLSFSGAGFMGCYYFGVVSCFNKYIPRDRIDRITGASAGSLSGAFYLLNLPTDKCLHEVLTMSEIIRNRSGGVFNRESQVVDMLPQILDRLFPDDAHRIVGNRLHVCMTRRKDFQKVVVNQFETRKDLIDALNCSCFIPVWSGNHCSTYKGEKYIDGGFTDNLPVFDENTIRICCFSGPTEISPYDRGKLDRVLMNFKGMPFYLSLVNLERGRRALFPPPASYIKKLIENGFRDTKLFILNSDLIKCESCYQQYGYNLSIQNQTNPSLLHHSANQSLRISPMISRSSSFSNLTDTQQYSPFLTNEQLERSLRKLRLHQQLQNNADDQEKLKLIEQEKLKLIELEKQKLLRLNSHNDKLINLSTSSKHYELSPLKSSSTKNDNHNENDLNSNYVSDIEIITTEEIDLAKQNKLTMKLNHENDQSNINNQNLIIKNHLSQDTTNNKSIINSFNLTNRLSSLLLTPELTSNKNLDSNCPECLHLRNEALNSANKIDDDDLMNAIIQQFMPKTDSNPSQINNKLSDTILVPFKWFRQLGTKAKL